jgi:hypothetical protein
MMNVAEGSEVKDLYPFNCNFDFFNNVHMMDDDKFVGKEVLKSVYLGGVIKKRLMTTIISDNKEMLLPMMENAKKYGLGHEMFKYAILGNEDNQHGKIWEGFELSNLRSKEIYDPDTGIKIANLIDVVNNIGISLVEYGALNESKIYTDGQYFYLFSFGFWKMHVMHYMHIINPKKTKQNVTGES